MNVDTIRTMSLAELGELDIMGLSDEQLGAVRERREELSDPRRAARASTEARREEMRALRRETFEATVLPDLEEEHGPVGVDLALVEHADGFVVVKRPSDILFRKWRDDVGKKGFVTSAKASEIARPHVVYPDKAGFGALVKRAPGVLYLAADACYELACNRKANDEGK